MGFQRCVNDERIKGIARRSKPLLLWIIDFSARSTSKSRSLKPEVSIITYTIRSFYPTGENRSILGIFGVDKQPSSTHPIWRP
jgi:hypothetical protein